MCTMKTLGVLVVGLGVCSAAHAATFMSFENSSYGTAGSDEPLFTAAGHTLSVETSGVGATDGTNSLKVGIPATAITGSNAVFNGTTIAARMNAAALVLTPGLSFEMDVTRPVATGKFTQLYVAFNYNRNSAPTNQSLNISPFASPLVASFGDTETGTKTIHWTVPFTDPRMDAGYWLQIYFKSNTGGLADTVYVDNLRMVPEPATFAAIGLASLGMISRRKAR